MEYILKQANSGIDTGAVKKLAGEAGISFFLASILYARDIRSAEEAKRFLHPSKDQLNPPALFRDMADSVSLIKNIIAVGGRICIYGDYDVDGTAACAILYRTLKKIGADAECILPSRMEHGYGLSADAVEEMKGVFDLLITVDCGISNVAEIALAKKHGIKTIITDHHGCGHVCLTPTPYLMPNGREKAIPTGSCAVLEWHSSLRRR
jgi:single-stranded-DNA-specific exonuclease